MFGVLESLTKAAVGVVVAPVTLVADTVMLVPDVEDNKDPFSRTGEVVKNIGENIQNATKPH
jgi:hypothetical protein